MEFLIPSLLFLFVFNASPTLGLRINLKSPHFKEMFCNQCQKWYSEGESDWTVFQRRVKGDVNFYRGWDDYAKGFGNLQGDFWLGLEPMHQLTETGNMELEIKMIKKDGIYWVAKYSHIRIGPASDKYRLYVSGFSGNATDGLSYHNKRQFSTKDADHDGDSRNCASHLEGGWWYDGCAYSNMNGNFHKTGGKGIWWNGFSNAMRFSEMKFRKRA